MQQSPRNRDVVWFLACLCISLIAFAVDVAGGALSASLTLAGDGMHVLLDGIAYSVAIFIAWRAHPETRDLAQLEGHAGGRRTIACLMGFTVVMLVAGVLWRILSPTPTLNAEAMSLAGLVGTGLNGLQYYILRRRDGELRYALSRHVLVDMAISICATVGALAIGWWSIPHIDTALTLVVAIWIGNEAKQLWRGTPHTH
jgi:Co/Zn/Cd efflux system component